MRYAIHIILALAFPSILNAQSTFQKIYQAGTSYSLDLIELPGNNILTPFGGTLLVNTEGYVEHASSFFGNGTYRAQTIRPAGMNNFFLQQVQSQYLVNLGAPHNR